MAKPTAKSTVKEMRKYIRDNKLKKDNIYLGLRRAELIAALRRFGHWDSQHDKPSAKVPAPKAVPKPAPKELGLPPKGVAPRPKKAQDVSPLKIGDKVSFGVSDGTKTSITTGSIVKVNPKSVKVEYRQKGEVKTKTLSKELVKK